MSVYVSRQLSSISYLAAIATGALILIAFLTGCSTVQSKVTNPLADKYGVRAPLDSFRRAEGASVGMIDPTGGVVSEFYVDRNGHVHTNGVIQRITIDRVVVPPTTYAPEIPVVITPSTNSLDSELRRLDELLEQPVK